MPPSAWLPAGTLVEVLCGQPEQKVGHPLYVVTGDGQGPPSVLSSVCGPPGGRAEEAPDSAGDGQCHHGRVSSARLGSRSRPFSSNSPNTAGERPPDSYTAAR